MDLSIVIPAYNEEKVIAQTLRKTIDYCKNSPQINNYEAIVVDDGSIDDTRAKVQPFLEDNHVKLTPKRDNHGKGYSVRQGILESKCDWILFMDADFSTSISELEKFFPYTKDYGILIATRNAKKSKTNRSKKRTIMSKTFVKINNLILGFDYSDTQCGFKLFRRDVAQKLFSKQQLCGFAFDAEILYLAKKHHHKVYEIPVMWVEGTDSKVHLLKDSFKMIKDLFKIKKMYK